MLVLFVAPTLSPNTLQCLRALLSLEGVRLGLITHAPVDRLPSFTRGKLTGHYRVENALEDHQLITAVRAFQSEYGRVDRLIGFLEHLQVPLAVARDATGVPGLGEAAARNFRDKNRMKSVLRANGLPVARQALVRSDADARRFVGEVGFPIVLKPVEGVGSVATQQARDEASLQRAVAELRPGPHRVFQAEEFIQGDERSFESVVIGGKTVWTSSTHYMNRPLEILENPWMQWCVLTPREGLDAHGQRFAGIQDASVRALGMHDGMAHTEWFLRSDGRAVVSEIGARPPGASFMDMLGLAHDADVWAAWCRLMVHGTWSLPERRFAVGCAYFRGSGPGRRVTGVTGLDEAQAAAGHLVVDRKLPMIGQVRGSSYEGDGWAILKHPSTEVVRAGLLAMISKVRVQYG
jgi:biotin carboxylase